MQLLYHMFQQISSFLRIIDQFTHTTSPLSKLSLHNNNRKAE